MGSAMSAQPTKRRVFISFEVEDRHYAGLMDAWSANDNDDFDMYDERLKVAVDSNNADYVKTKIRPKISRATVLVCLIGRTTYQSEWVTWEIDYAKKEGKGLVGVRLRGGNRIPASIDDSGAVFVAYKEREIQKAIEWAATAGKTSENWTYNN